MIFQKYYLNVWPWLTSLRIGITGWLIWTRWWIFWFHEVPRLPWLAEEIAGSVEGLCCMEFRRTALLKLFSFSFSLFTEESGIYSLQGQKNFTAQPQDPIREPPNLVSFRQRELLSEIKGAVTWGRISPTLVVQFKIVYGVILPIPPMSLKNTA